MYICQGLIQKFCEVGSWWLYWSMVGGWLATHFLFPPPPPPPPPPGSAPVYAHALYVHTSTNGLLRHSALAYYATKQPKYWQERVYPYTLSYQLTLVE